jgi:hypothetical protein
MAVFSRELAQSASNCCPHGMRERRVRSLPAPELRDLALDAELDLHRAVQDLEAERSAVAARPVPLPAARGRRRRSTGRRSHLIDPLSALPSLWRRPGPPFEEAAAYEMTELARENGGGSDSGGGGPPSSARCIDRGGPGGGEAVECDDDDDDLEQANGSSKSSGGGSVREWNGASDSRLSGWRESARSIFRDRDWRRQIGEAIWKVRWAPRPSSVVSDAAALRENSYAVLTFTSRQAAAAARQCISSRRDLSLHDIPIPPLADAAPCTVLPCRFVCRPVTVSARDWQKNARLYL